MRMFVNVKINKKLENKIGKSDPKNQQHTKGPYQCRRHNDERAHTKPIIIIHVVKCGHRNLSQFENAMTKAGIISVRHVS